MELKRKRGELSLHAIRVRDWLTQRPRSRYTMKGLGDRLGIPSNVMGTVMLALHNRGYSFLCSKVRTHRTHSRSLSRRKEDAPKVFQWQTEARCFRMRLPSTIERDCK